MKTKLIGIALVLSSLLCTQGFAQNLPVIDKAKKTFDVYMDSNDDTPLTFGYENADVKSKKSICFSTMTADVENNPYKCFLGAYYTTEGIEIEYIATEGDFVKLAFKSSSKPDVIFYIEKKMVKFQ